MLLALLLMACLGLLKISLLFNVLVLVVQKMLFLFIY